MTPTRRGSEAPPRTADNSDGTGRARRVLGSPVCPSTPSARPPSAHELALAGVPHPARSGAGGPSVLHTPSQALLEPGPWQLLVKWRRERCPQEPHVARAPAERVEEGASGGGRDVSERLWRGPAPPRTGVGCRPPPVPHMERGTRVPTVGCVRPVSLCRGQIQGHEHGQGPPPNPPAGLSTDGPQPAFLLRKRTLPEEMPGLL